MRTNLYRLPSEEALTDAKLNEFIMRHSGECAFRYNRLQEAYETDYPILHEPPSPGGNRTTESWSILQNISWIR
nr:MAG TPA: hypothetical protein [Bacteriophage sp.]